MCGFTLTHKHTLMLSLSHNTHWQPISDAGSLQNSIFVSYWFLYLLQNLHILFTRMCVLYTYIYFNFFYFTTSLWEEPLCGIHLPPVGKTAKNIQEKYVDCKDANLYGGSIARLDQIHCLHMLKCRCIDGCIDVCKMKMKNENVCFDIPQCRACKSI